MTATVSRIQGRKYFRFRNIFSYFREDYVREDGKSKVNIGGISK